MDRRTRILLSLEFAFIFVAMPVFLFLHTPSISPIPLVWLFAAYCLLVLIRDPTYARSGLWNPRPLRSQLREMLLLFVIGAALLTGLTALFAPVILFNFVRTHPIVWAVVMVLYPVLSVYPQGVIYRAFLLHRYRNLFGTPGQNKWALIFISALAFSLVHTAFRNWVAVALTFPGGLIFARRHMQTRSLFVSSFEHALYGCFLFSVGLGDFFYRRLV